MAGILRLPFSLFRFKNVPKLKSVVTRRNMQICSFLNIGKYQPARNINEIIYKPLNDVSELPFNLPSVKSPFTEIYDRIPLLNVNLPCIDPSKSFLELPPLKEEPEIQCKGGLLRIRKKKMNKHKLQKRRKRDRAKIRKVLMGREKQKRKSRAKKKIRLEEKIENLLKDHPNSTYEERPYVIHRLNKW